MHKNHAITCCRNDSRIISFHRSLEEKQPFCHSILLQRLSFMPLLSLLTDPLHPALLYEQNRDTTEEQNSSCASEKPTFLSSHQKSPKPTRNGDFMRENKSREKGRWFIKPAKYQKVKSLHPHITQSLQLSVTTSEPVRITNSLCMGLLPTPIQQRVPQLREHVSSSCLLSWSSCLETQTQKTESSYFQILLRWLFTHLQYSILSFQLSLLIILASTVCKAEVKKWSKDKMFPSHLKAGLTSVQHG